VVEAEAGDRAGTREAMDTTKAAMVDMEAMVVMVTMVTVAMEAMGIMVTETITTDMDMDLVTMAGKGTAGARVSTGGNRRGTNRTERYNDGYNHNGNWWQSKNTY